QQRSMDAREGGVARVGAHRVDQSDPRRSELHVLELQEGRSGQCATSTLTRRCTQSHSIRATRRPAIHSRAPDSSIHFTCAFGNQYLIAPSTPHRSKPVGSPEKTKPSTCLPVAANCCTPVIHV